MPLKTLMPSTVIPRTLPDDVSTVEVLVSDALPTRSSPPACAPANNRDAFLRKLLRLTIFDLSFPPSPINAKFIRLPRSPGMHPGVFLWHHAVMASVASEMVPPTKIEALRRVFEGHDRMAQAILARFPGPAPAERISGRAYLLCITPRSGSSMLADVLGRTESVGTAEEHFPSSS